MAQLMPTEKVLVAKDFLDTKHGEIGCENCHGGDPGKKSKAAAHSGFDPQPSINDPEKACGECHEAIVATVKTSLHATLSTFPTILKSRSDMGKWHKIDEARNNHCASCHTSCGGCHVSRPEFAKKGFIKGHNFQKRSDPINQCTACHGSRIGNEYYGLRGQGDVHVSKYDMDCVECHGAKEMHAAAPEDLADRYHLKEMVSCENCHQDLELGSVSEHQIHLNKVQCQVCHSQTYVSCYSCHTGKDDEGFSHFQNQREVEKLKIGMNYDRGVPKDKNRFILVRHVPVDLELFDFYVKDAFTNFGNLPTWKRTSPHNIQRKTWQAANCNNCHGNRELFLSENDLLDYEKEANSRVVVPDNFVPRARKKVVPLNIDTSNVKAEMVVSANWLHDNLGKKGIKIVDASGPVEYKLGHIEGSVDFGLIKSGLLNPLPDKLTPDMNPGKLLKVLGEKGLKVDDHIIVYDKHGINAGFILWALKYAGAHKISFLDGGIEGWREAGYPGTKKVTKPETTIFNGKIDHCIHVGSDFVKTHIASDKTIIVDVRVIHQAKGLTKTAASPRAGRIPGSINLPLASLIADNGFLKKPEELIWMLKQYGITPEKTIITACNTGYQAANAYFFLSYLGFENVKVYYVSWEHWSKDY